jgi:hypothetical protein
MKQREAVYSGITWTLSALTFSVGVNTLRFYDPAERVRRVFEAPQVSASLHGPHHLPELPIENSTSIMNGVASLLA